MKHLIALLALCVIVGGVSAVTYPRDYDPEICGSEMNSLPLLPMAFVPHIVSINGVPAPAGTLITFSCPGASPEDPYILRTTGGDEWNFLEPKIIIQGTPGCGGQIPIEINSPITFYVNGVPAYVRLWTDAAKYGRESVLHLSDQSLLQWDTTFPWVDGMTYNIDLYVGDISQIPDDETLLMVKSATIDGPCTTWDRNNIQWTDDDYYWINKWKTGKTWPGVPVETRPSCSEEAGRPRTTYFSDKFEELATEWFHPNYRHEQTEEYAQRMVWFADHGGYGCSPDLKAMVQAQGWLIMHTSYGWPYDIGGYSDDPTYWSRISIDDPNQLPSMFCPPINHPLLISTGYPPAQAYASTPYTNPRTSPVSTDVHTTTPTTVPTTIPTTSPTPVPSPTAPPSVSVTEIENEIFLHVNQERISNGLGSLELDSELSVIAREHSSDMLEHDYFNHINLDGQNPTERAHERGYYCSVGENIAKIQNPDVTLSELGEEFVNIWMDSSSHRANILNPAYKRIGVGVATDGDSYLATQDFVYCTESSVVSVYSVSTNTGETPNFMFKWSNDNTICFVMVWDELVEKWVWAQAFLNL